MFNPYAQLGLGPDGQPLPPGNTPSGMTPEQQNQWFQMMMQNQQQINAEKVALEGGPKLQFAPVKEYWVDASGNPVSKKTPGAIQKVALRDEYKMSGPEGLIEAMMSQQKGLEVGQKDDAVKSTLQANAAKNAGLGMRGGVRGSDRMRLAKAGEFNLMGAKQDISRKGAEARMGITLKGEELKRATEAANLETLFKGADSTNKFELEKYKKQKEVEAAKQSADATRAAANSGGGGSYICTAITESGACDDSYMESLHAIGLKHFFKHAKLAFWYLTHVKPAVEAAKRQNFDFSFVKKEFIDDSVEEYAKFGSGGAGMNYLTHTLSFCKSFGFSYDVNPVTLVNSTFLENVYYATRCLFLPVAWKLFFDLTGSFKSKLEEV